MAFALLYAACVVVHVAPPSPARAALNPTATTVLSPYFEQAWNLFSPTPPTTNQRLYAYLRYSDAGKVREAPPENLTAELLHQAKSRPWAPPRIYRIELVLVPSLAYYQPTMRQPGSSDREGRADGHGVPEQGDPGLPLPVNQRIQQINDDLLSQTKRILSALGIARYGNNLVGVRAVIVQAPVRAYGSTATPVATLIFDSGWLDPDLDVSH